MVLPVEVVDHIAMKHSVILFQGSGTIWTGDYKLLRGQQGARSRQNEKRMRGGASGLVPKPGPSGIKGGKSRQALQDKAAELPAPAPAQQPHVLSPEELLMPVNLPYWNTAAQRLLTQETDVQAE